MALGKKIRSVGLSAILFGDVTDGGAKMPDEMKQLARTLKGTATFTTEQDQTQAFFCEEEPDAPVESVISEKGLKNLTFNILEWDNAVLQTLFGGKEVDGKIKDLSGTDHNVKKFIPPKDYVEVEKAIRVLTPYKVGFDIPRAKILARFQWNLTRTEIAQIEVTAHCMTPDGDDSGTYEPFSWTT